MRKHSKGCAEHLRAERFLYQSCDTLYMTGHGFEPRTHRQSRVCEYRRDFNPKFTKVWFPPAQRRTDVLPYCDNKRGFVGKVCSYKLTSSGVRGPARLADQPQLKNLPRLAWRRKVDARLWFIAQYEPSNSFLIRGSNQGGVQVPSCP